MKSKNYFGLIFLSLLLVTISCGKKSDVSPAQDKKAAPTSTGELKRDEAPASEMDEEAPASPKDGTKGGEERERKTTRRDIGEPMNPFSEAAKDRLLEYKVNLRIKCKSLKMTRKELIEIIKKESFIRSSQTQVESQYESMVVEIHVPSSELYNTLLSIDKLGNLLSESIYTDDWTETNEEQKIKLDREHLRSSRRSVAATKGSPENWNWKDREELLERSEDNMDAARLESWKIKDKVKWAKVTINLVGEEIPDEIVIPNFRDAFIAAINFMLSVVYGILFLIPVGAVLVGLYFLYKKIRGR